MSAGAHGIRHRSWWRFWWCLGLLFSVHRPAWAHPIHTTLTAVTMTSTGATILLRAFDDDFSASVAQFAGKPTPKDSTVLPDDVLRYVQAHVGFLNAAGQNVPLTSCGVRRERGLYWVCLHTVDVPGLDKLRVRNAVLMERHADQVNIVQVVRGSARRTLLLTKEQAMMRIE